MKCKVDVERLRGYKIKLYPTEAQKKKLNRFIELSRYVYNWAVATINEAYAITGEFSSFTQLCKIFKDFRHKLSWLEEIPVCTARQAIKDAVNGFMKFFNKQANHPKFKRKSKPYKKSFTSRGERMYIFGDSIKLEGFERGDLILAKDHRLPSGEGIYYYDPTITFDGDNYWLSTTIYKEVQPLDIPVSEPIGIDVGIRNLVTTSYGETFHLPDTSKLQKRRNRQRRRLQKDYDKLLAEGKRTKTKYHDMPKSKNMLKRQTALRKTFRRISNINNTYIHTMTKRILDRNPSAIVIENISVEEMTKKNPFLNRKKPQMMFYTIHEQLRYKAADRGIPVITADKYFPSTKTCNRCGYINNIGSSAIYTCEACGYTIDRDLNAAYNLRDLAYNNQY